MRILVTGATGYVGSRLVTALLADQHQVIAASRNPERSQALRLVRPGYSGASGRIRSRRRRQAALQLPPTPRADRSTWCTTWSTPSASAISVTPTTPPPPTSRPLPGTPVCAASSTWVVSCPTTDPSEHLASRAEVAQALSVWAARNWCGWVQRSSSAPARRRSRCCVMWRTGSRSSRPRPGWTTRSTRSPSATCCTISSPRRIPPGCRRGPTTFTGPTPRRIGAAQDVCARRGQVAGHFPGPGFHTAVTSRVPAYTFPVPFGLAGDLVDSLDHPMVASVSGLRDRVPDPPGGLLGARGGHCSGSWRAGRHPAAG